MMLQCWQMWEINSNCSDYLRIFVLCNKFQHSTRTFAETRDGGGGEVECCCCAVLLRLVLSLQRLNDESLSNILRHGEKWCVNFKTQRSSKKNYLIHWKGNFWASFYQQKFWNFRMDAAELVAVKHNSLCLLSLFFITNSIRFYAKYPHLVLWFIRSCCGWSFIFCAIENFARGWSGRRSVDDRRHGGGRHSLSLSRHTLWS